MTQYEVWRILALTGILSLLGACGDAFTPEGKRTDAIEKFDLSVAQIDVMDAYFVGLTRHKSEPAHSRRYTQVSACYAHQIKIADRYDIPHREYIRDMETIDLNYRAWFKKHGIMAQDATDIVKRVRETTDYCKSIVRG